MLYSRKIVTSIFSDTFSSSIFVFFFKYCEFHWRQSTSFISRTISHVSKHFSFLNIVVVVFTVQYFDSKCFLFFFSLNSFYRTVYKVFSLCLVFCINIFLFCFVICLNISYFLCVLGTEVAFLCICLYI